MKYRNSLLSLIREDFRANIFFKSKLIILLYRLSNYFACKNKFTYYFGFPIYLIYILVVDWILGVEIPIKTKIGRSITIHHGYGIVVNGFAIIGDYCILRQGVTLGNKLYRDGTFSGAPIIGNYVEFGANSIVIGSITIGHNSTIGAGSVVTKNVPDFSIVAGVPAKIIGINK